MMTDLYNSQKLVMLLAPQSINDTDTNSLVLDTRDFNRAAVAVAIGDCTGLDADSTLELLLQESDDTVSANFTAVPVAQMIRDTTGLSSTTTAGLFATLNLASEDQTIKRASYIGTKRYIRVKADFTTGTGGISAAPLCVIGTLANPKHGDTAAPAAITAS